MRIVFAAACLAMLVAGLLFGALNSVEVQLDFYVWQTRLSLGSSVLLAALLGALGAGICLWLAVIIPLQSRLRKARSALSGSLAVATEGKQDPT